MELLKYTAMMSAKRILDNQEIFANNIANASTIGFKSILISPIILSNNISEKDNEKVLKKYFDPTPGVFRHTQRPLDIAIINQNGWLEIKTKKNNLAYTKNGNLQINSKRELTSLGNIVIGKNGPIIIPEHKNIKVLSDGTIKIVRNNNNVDETIDKIKLVNIDFKDLNYKNGGLYFFEKSNLYSKNIKNCSNIKILSETLEDSNVNVSENIIKIIEDSRKFDIQMKILHNCDENTQLINKFLNINN
ncbi:MAG: flagellar basal body rod C-terminal domain-containing protein [Buchnera aphidicola (Nurudea yanoniella)]